MDLMMKKLKILADGAKYDVSCSSSGSDRRNNGKMGNTSYAGICHSWAADGRCISLLKVLFSNKCVYDCEYCVNRRSADVERASFEPDELARLTMEFYRRNYIEGLFLSSAVEVSPDNTGERILECLQLLRKKYGFAGYIHAKIIPGISEEITYGIGLEADRLSVNIEMPSSDSLALLAPQKKPREIFAPMKQITNALIERKSLKGPGTMFKGKDLNSAAEYLTPSNHDPEKGTLLGGSSQTREEVVSYDIKGSKNTATAPVIKRKKKYSFAPAGQTTQMIIGASKESDYKIMKTTENLYRTFKMKRVYYSAYIPIVESAVLPGKGTLPPLAREHRLYQADWLLRFYGFRADELLNEKNPDLDTEVDPKVSWALRNIHMFPMEINKASMDQLLRIPGIGSVSALRILRQRRLSAVTYDDLKKMGVVLKRAKYFLTCSGKFYGDKKMMPQGIRTALLGQENGVQMSMFDPEHVKILAAGDRGRKVIAGD